MTTPTTLDQLLASLSPQMSKAAAEGEGSDDKGSDSDKTPAFLKKDDKKEDGKKEDAKKDDKSEDDDSEGQTKEAAAAGSALAREIMQKTAAAMNTPIEGNTPMNKQASQAGQTLAQALLAQLTKSAGEAETNTPDGLFPESVPTRLQRDTAEMVHEQASQTKPMPTSDGLRPTGTINQLFDAIVADAVGQGAASTDQVHTTGVSQVEGAVEDHATPNQAEEVEKTAALNALIEQGFSFDDATSMVKAAAWELEQEADELEKAAAVNTLVSEYGVNYDDAISMVKAAEAQIQFEEIELEKTAYLNALMSEGVDFDSAVAMIKSASELETNQHDGIFQESVPTRLQRDVAEQVAEHDSIIRPMQTSDGLRPTGSINEIFDAVIADALGQGAASVDQVHSTGVSQVEGAVEDHAVPNQVGEVEKVAALSSFLAAGVDFDSAVAMVKEAEATAGDYARSFISPGWMRSEVAKRNGGETSRSDDVYNHFVGGARQGLRGYAEGVAGGLVGSGIGHLAGLASPANRSALAGIGAAAGGLAGLVHGAGASIRNQVAEEEALHQKKASQQLLLGQKRGLSLGKKLAIGGAALGTAGLAGAAVANRGQEKKAGVMDSIRTHATNARLSAHAVRNGSKAIRNSALVDLAKNPLVQGGAAVGAAGGYGAYRAATPGGDGGQVKQAEATLGDYGRGYISPGWMRSEVAKRNGGETSLGDDVYNHFVGGLRAGGRALLEGAAFGAAGHGAGGLLGRLSPKHQRAAMIAGAKGGYVGGAIHGMKKSFDNQVAEQEALHQEKKAAVNLLMDNGVDFDSAVALVAAKSQELYGE